MRFSFYFFCGFSFAVLDLLGGLVQGGWCLSFGDRTGKEAHGVIQD
jgi:hypothetical protein